MSDLPAWADQLLALAAVVATSRLVGATAFSAVDRLPPRKH